MTASATPLVSVVIPTFNRAAVILSTLNSVLNQTWPHLEVWVVDDASTDDTAAIMATVTDPRVHFVALPANTGGTRPRNEGIARARGEYIALLDSDDSWLPEKLEKQLAFMQRQGGERRVCMTAKINLRPEGQHVRRNKPLKGYRSIMEYLLLGNDFQTSTLLLDADMAKRAGFDPGLRKHQDWDFALRLEEQGAQFLYLDEPLTYYDDADGAGRISSDGKREKSLAWLEGIKSRVPSDIWYGFYAKIIADSYLLSAGEKGKGVKIYLRLLLAGKIKPGHFCQMMGERVQKLALILFKKMRRT
ncbi:glycosyltransferase family 2 protein [Pantoea sp. 1.19]|uniref:glycosyltransferase family 2 protein n=1 Tax=Pantoea sp. 1.19 TaxID=1925589 RepID=UPI000948D243|nr:glycosyltransferase family 2 protein [Pantoea sp. 1.19]